MLHRAVPRNFHFPVGSTEFSFFLKSTHVAFTIGRAGRFRFEFLRDFTRFTFLLLFNALLMNSTGIPMKTRHIVSVNKSVCISRHVGKPDK